MEGEYQNIINKIDQMVAQSPLNNDSSQKNIIQSLPKSLIDFLNKKQISLQQMFIKIPRYIRTKPNFNCSLSQLALNFKIPQKDILEIDDQFYALSPLVKINGTKYYQNSSIYGMDYSSAIPVRCLEAQQGNRVLQLCSAPGNKSMYLADKFKDISITAVQINENRAQIMKNLVKKYDLDDKIRIKVEDGLKFDCQQKFDRVLVDAQCTHEGSIKHLKKFLKQPQTYSQEHLKKNKLKRNKQKTKQQQKQFERNNSNPYTSLINQCNQWTEKDFQQRFLDPFKLSNLFKLQLGLLQNGFRMLKEKGIMVYSTCSFDKQQNQSLIKYFISKFEETKEKYYPKILDASENLTTKLGYQKCEGLEQAIRLSPKTSRSGGMFVCKITKIQRQIQIQSQ